MAVVDIPTESSLLLKAFEQSVVSCPTFVALVGAVDSDAARARVHHGFAADEFADDGLNGFPRAILDDSFPQTGRIECPGSSFGSGNVGLYVQYEELSLDELATWYELTSGQTFANTERTHRKHCWNLLNRLHAELNLVSRTPGCLEIGSITSQGCGLEDPVENNNQRIWAIEFLVEWQGQLL